MCNGMVSLSEDLVRSYGYCLCVITYLIGCCNGSGPSNLINLFKSYTYKFNLLFPLESREAMDNLQRIVPRIQNFDQVLIEELFQPLGLSLFIQIRSSDRRLSIVVCLTLKFHLIFYLEHLYLHRLYNFILFLTIPDLF